MCEIKLNKTGLYVVVDRICYKFFNNSYSMELTLMKEDVNIFLRNPCNNFYYGSSFGNRIMGNDRNDIIQFLRGTRKYKTVSSCVRYSKPSELENNMISFTTEDIYNYIKSKSSRTKERRTYVKSST